MLCNLFICVLSFWSRTQHPPKCPDEEHTTCSGGTDTEECATARLAQGYAGRQVAQTHHENHNLTFSIST